MTQNQALRSVNQHVITEKCPATINIFAISSEKQKINPKAPTKAGNNDCGQTNSKPNDNKDISSDSNNKINNRRCKKTKKNKNYLPTRWKLWQNETLHIEILLRSQCSKETASSAQKIGKSRSESTTGQKTMQLRTSRLKNWTRNVASLFRKCTWQTGD